MDRIYTIDIDSNLDGRLKEFQKMLKEGEEIVHQTTTGSKLIITVRETKKGRRNLLLEEHGARLK